MLAVAWLLIFSSAAQAAPSCETALMSPVPGKTLRPFVPIDKGGHWGIDLASLPARVVRSPVTGTVTFAGKVAAMASVTVAPLPRIRVSLSYLSEIWVVRGQRVRAGQPLGRSGTDHGIPAVHLSLRVDGRYTDPRPALDCGVGSLRIPGTVKLLPHR